MQAAAQLASVYLPQPQLRGYTPHAALILRLGPTETDAVVVSPAQVQALTAMEYQVGCCSHCGARHEQHNHSS